MTKITKKVKESKTVKVKPSVEEVKVIEEIQEAETPCSSEPCKDTLIKKQFIERKPIKSIHEEGVYVIVKDTSGCTYKLTYDQYYAL